MPIVRLTGTVEGADDPNRSKRAKLLYRLFDGGWDIYNSNGDQTITLGNIQKKIAECDGFVFTPGANMQDIFQAASIFVGFQTNDGELCGKPAVLINSDGSWDSFIALITHLNQMGTVHQHYDEFLTVTHSTKDVLKVLDDSYDGRTNCPAVEPDIMENKTPEDYSSVIREGAAEPKYKVCVFCSASIKKPKYLDYGRYIGNAIADNGWGCISGAGKTGIMGEVVQGCYEQGGWSGGSNVPHIIALEGLPKGLTEFWPRGDIYTRMEIMIDRSDSFIIMPGGLGTVQELLALIILKQHKRDIMRDKEIVVVNVFDDDSGLNFWDPLLKLLDRNDFSNMYKVVETPQEAMSYLESCKKQC